MIVVGEIPPPNSVQARKTGARLYSDAWKIDVGAGPGPIRT